MLPRSATAVTPKSATTRSFLTAHDAEAPSDPRPRALTRFAQTCALVPHRGRSIRPAPSVSSSEPVRLDVQTSSSLHQKTLSWRVFVAVNLTVAVRFGCGWWRWRCLGRFYMERNPINGLSRPAFGYSYPLCVLVPAASCTHAVPDRRSRDRIGTNFRGSLMSLFLA
uniref:(northern house mosquito) hypothetical protein n=1 Tax=Culex pipiens TaxID=7175 RepID=A0A8D8PA11_CULPI